MEADEWGGTERVGEGTESVAWKKLEERETVIEQSETFASSRTADVKEKKPKKKAKLQRVRCPYCWEGLPLRDADDPERVIGAHVKHCWWLEKNGRGHVGWLAGKIPVATP